MVMQACLNPDPAKRKTCAELKGMAYMAEVSSLKSMPPTCMVGRCHTGQMPS